MMTLKAGQLVRGLAVVFAVCAVLMLAACGDSKTTPPAVAVAISPSAAQTLDEGQTRAFTASVTNDSSNKGVTWTLSGTSCTGNACGTLTNITTTGVTYSAPSPLTASLTVTITATSVADTTKSTSISVTAMPAPAITTTSLASGTVGIAYSVTLETSGGITPRTWSVVTGNLPAGLSLAAGSGVISGTPTTTATSNFTVQVADSASPAMTAQKALSITINPAALTVTTSALPTVAVGSAYNVTLQASGGTPPVAWTLTGTLPVGLGLNATTGAISGTPTVPGTTEFTVTATDSGTQTANKTLSISVNPVLSITTTALADGASGTAYSATLQAAGGTPPVTWSTVDGSFPNGLTLNANTGAITGTPTAPGVADFTIRATDASTPVQTTQVALSITIAAAPLTFETDSLPNGAVNSEYSTTLQTTGGLPPVTYAITVGSLPEGLSLDGATGVVSGIPTAPGTSNFTVQATDSDTPARTVLKDFSLRVNTTGTNNSELNGQYAFLLEGTDTGGNGFLTLAGKFTADGSGNLTGVLDVNALWGNGLNESFTGFYSVGADHRGTITINSAVEAINHLTFAFSLGGFSSGTAGMGRMISFSEGGPRLAGTLKKQDPASFSNASLNGSFALGAAGATENIGSFVMIGRFTANGAGGISAGAVDPAYEGEIDSTKTFTGSYEITDNGRGTVTLNVTGLSEPIHQVVYLISANEMFMISADEVGSDNNLYTGRMLKQSGGSFSNASLNGNAVVYFQGRGRHEDDIWVGADAFVGRLTANGAGGATVDLDQNHASHISSQTGESIGYSINANGRGTITTGEEGGPLIYMVSQNTAFIMDDGRSLGMVEPQSSGPFTNASISGNYLFGFEPYSWPGNSVEAGIVAADGAGNLSGTTDDNEEGNVNSKNFTATYNVSSTGRATVGPNPEIMYIISPTKAVMISIQADDVNPTLRVVER